jgi:hypothetical protein
MVGGEVRCGATYATGVHGAALAGADRRGGHHGAGDGLVRPPDPLALPLMGGAPAGLGQLAAPWVKAEPHRYHCQPTTRWDAKRTAPERGGSKLRGIEPRPSAQSKDLH